MCTDNVAAPLQIHMQIASGELGSSSSARMRWEIVASRRVCFFRVAKVKESQSQ